MRSASVSAKPGYIAGDDPWRLIEGSSATGGDARSLLPYAIVAPSAVNNQPWTFRVCEEGIEIYRDIKRAFSPLIMPKHEYVYVALGAATENLVIAARHMGHRVQADFLPKGESADPTVLVRLQGKTDSNPPSPLLSAIPKRHTNRKMYTGETLGTHFFRELSSIAEEEGFRLSFVTDRASVEKVADMVGDANTAQFEDDAVYPELYEWFRFTREELVKTRDGMPIDSYNLHGPGSWVAHAGGMRPRVIKVASRLGMAPMYSSSYRRAVASSSAICLLSTSSASALNLLKGGRVFERIALTLTSMGLAYQPLMNVFEVRAFRTGLKEVYSLREGETLMHFRIGMAKEPAVVSPRRAVREVLR